MALKLLKGYINGKGTLVVINKKGETITYSFPNKNCSSVTLHIGDTMQWFAEDDLVIFEICYPPYEDGRFENLN